VAGDLHLSFNPCADAFFIGQGFVRTLKKILSIPIDFILPERCPACGEITPAGGGFCATCWQKLHFFGPPYCASCSQSLPFDSGNDQICASCIQKKPLHDGIRAAVAYGDVARQVALKLKYGGKIGLAKVIASQLRHHLPTERNNLVVAPVPLHWTRLWKRSFNQSALIGQWISRENDISFVPDLLVRTKRTPYLKGLSGNERRRTMANAFTINPRWQNSISNARIILVDDVYTSGATSDACVKALKKAGAEWVQIFCWARVLRGEIITEAMMGALDA
jgi:ComF family protein